VHLRQSTVLGVIVAAVALACTCSSAGAYIYWPSSDVPVVLDSANLDGSNVQSVDGGVGVGGWLASDGRHVYFDNGLDPTIGRVSPDGTGLASAFVRIPTPTCSPFEQRASASAIAVDASYVYWTDDIAGTIGRASVADGSGANDQFIQAAIGNCGTTDGGGPGPEGLAVDASHIYWTNSSPGTIGRANLDGSAPTQSFISGAQNPSAVAVAGSNLYWSNNLDVEGSGPGTIGHALLDGSGALITGSVNQSFITGVSSYAQLAVAGGSLYFDDGHGWIGRSSLDGSAITPHLVNYGDPDRPRTGLAADAGQASPTTTSVACRHQPLEVLAPHYYSRNVYARPDETASCTVTVRNLAGPPTQVSGIVALTQTPHEGLFSVPHGSAGAQIACRLRPSSTPGVSTCTVDYTTYSLERGFVPHAGRVSLTAAYGGGTTSLPSTGRGAIALQTDYVIACKHFGDGYVAICDAHGHYLTGGPRGKLDQGWEGATGPNTRAKKFTIAGARVTVTVPLGCVTGGTRIPVAVALSGKRTPVSLKLVEFRFGPDRPATIRHPPYRARLLVSTLDGSFDWELTAVVFATARNQTVQRTFTILVPVC
jgi:hypothetical protein